MGGVTGLHHVICVVADIERTRDFYVNVLGMVQLRETVNFDETTVLQLYCGERSGRPGTIISLLHYPNAPLGRRGTGQVSNIVFAIEKDSESDWLRHLRENNVPLEGLAWSFGKKFLCLSDPDGLAISLTETDRLPVVTSPALAVGAIASVEIIIRGFEHTFRLLSDIFDFSTENQEGPVTRLRNRNSEEEFTIDLVSSPNHRRGVAGRGLAHCLVFATQGPADLPDLRSRLASSGFDVTPILDRLFFQAIYFSGPEELPLAIASGEPGFGAPSESAGGLTLPPWLESRRSGISRCLGRSSPRIG